MTRDRIISVTRRHLDFLFNREETVVTDVERRFKAAIIESYRTNGRARTVTQGADLAWEATRHLFDGFELQLPPSDESKVGQD